MTTVDKILINLLNTPIEAFTQVPSRDIKVLKSLGKIIQGTTFITENQSKLLLKILRENYQKFGMFSEDIESAVEQPSWSFPFRPVDKTKKVYINSDNQIIVEFAFSSLFRKILSEKSKSISGFAQVGSGKLYQADLSERNIVLLVELLKPHGFDIEEKIEDFYKIIKSWSKNDIKDQFLFENLEHTTFQKLFANEIPKGAYDSELLVVDRSHKYQYFTNFPVKSGVSLTEKIAFRTGTKFWVDSTHYKLVEVIQSLKELNRLPALVVFDTANSKKITEELANFASALDDCEILDLVGIYFRLPNDEAGAAFNSFIAERKYNCYLDKDTQIVGVQNGKIPKFLLKSDWRPTSVIAIGSPLRHTKTAVYANNCDLVISYTEQQPIIDTRPQWE